jgi:hypothetical protein
MTPEGRLISRITTAIKTNYASDQPFVLKVHGGAFQVRGLPDLFVLIRGRFIALEAKVVGNGPTRLQLKRCRDINAAGGHAAVVYSVDEALAVVSAALASSGV